MSIIKSSDTDSIKRMISKISLPESNSHKGQNGKVLVIGGSSLFHAASIWAAEVASHFVDIVHYSSTTENNEIMVSLKKKFVNGIVVSQNDLEHYVKEDETILIGPGMVRSESFKKKKLHIANIKKLQTLNDEAGYTYYLTKYLIYNYPEKKYVFDAGSLQMMDPQWLTLLKNKPIITPHQKEFQRLFGIDVHNLSIENKSEIVKEKAKQYNSVILLKAIDDIVSDGKEIFIIQGGNAGLTKGGTGDTLAGLTLSFLVKQSPLQSAVFGSVILKRAADELLLTKGYWYNISDIIQRVPETLNNLVNRA